MAPSFCGFGARICDHRQAARRDQIAAIFMSNDARNAQISITPPDLYGLMQT
jgi:hypothetical protein